jgi:Ca2+-binding EF-hand superfamily protein
MYIFAGLLLVSFVSAGAEEPQPGVRLTGAALDNILSPQHSTPKLTADRCFRGKWPAETYPSLAAIPIYLRERFDGSTAYEEQYLAKLLGSTSSRFRSRGEDAANVNVHAIELLARKAFHTADTDGDCHLSDAETQTVKSVTWGPGQEEGISLQAAADELDKRGLLSLLTLRPPRGIPDKCFSGSWSGELYTRPADIPEAFRSLLEPKWTTYEIDLISKALKLVHDDNNPAKTWIEQLDVNVAKNDLVTIRNMLQERLFDALDLNKDGTVTQGELITFYNKSNADREAAEQSAATVMMLFDRNGDSVITKAEMRYDSTTDDTPERVSLEWSVGFRHEPLPIESKLQLLTQFLLLAPQGSSKLTADDIEMLTRKVFHTIDTDGDCVISKSEYVAAKDPAHARAHDRP